MTIKERPGVYAEYMVNSGAIPADTALTVGVAAQVIGSGTAVESVGSYLASVQSYGVSNMSKLIKTLYLNGCGSILAAPVASSNYAAAFTGLINKGADIIICDSADAAVISALNTAISGTDYCMGIAECAGTAVQCVSLAQSINFERIVICGNSDGVSGNISAALAGVIASESELYLNSHALLGIGTLTHSWTEAEIEALITGGVTPIEADGSGVCVVRGVTTKTSTNGVSDKSLREIATVLTVTEVLKSVYSALKLKFSNAKNDALTRGAIRSQVAVVLQKKLNEGKISDYGSISAVADTQNPALCSVGFEFTAVCGLSTIALTAYLNV